MTQQVPQPVVPVCYRHPRRETYVRCVRCERPICPDCMSDAAVGHQCPECVAEGRRTQRGIRTVFGGTRAGVRGYVTKTLIGINCAVMLLSAASAGGGNALIGGNNFGGLLGSDTPLLEHGGVIGRATLQNGGSIPYGIADGEYYRLFTSMFLHFGLLHLLMNMWALWLLGRNLEAALGPVRFLALYLLSGLGGSVAVYLFAPTGLTAGASGAIFGLFAALFVLLKRLGRDTSSVVPILVVNLAISFVPGISLAGHVGGLITGGVIAAALAYAPQRSRNLVTAGVSAGLVVLFAVLCLVQTHAIQSVPFAF
jgi:membrane associated rhomboid family serine protease